MKPHSTIRLGIVLFLLVASLASPGTGRAQGTRADYDRARQFQKLTENKVFRASVKPHWLPGNTKFWYRLQTGADTHEFRLVDALTGVKQPAFDHARLATAAIIARTDIRGDE